MKLFSNSRITTTGALAEQRACSFLKNHGMKLITQNYRYRGGEIDLIMSDGETTVFIEVKCRKDVSHGHPFENIDHRKQQKLTRTAEHFCLSRFKSTCVNMRFDGFAIIGDPNAKTAQMEWLKNIIIL